MDMSSRQEETESSSSKNERQVHLVLIVKTDFSSNLEDNNSNDEINPCYDKIFDKYEEMLREFKKVPCKYKLLK